MYGALIIERPCISQLAYRRISNLQFIWSFLRAFGGAGARGGNLAGFVPIWTDGVHVGIAYSGPGGDHCSSC